MKKIPEFQPSASCFGSLNGLSLKKVEAWLTGTNQDTDADTMREAQMLREMLARSGFGNPNNGNGGGNGNNGNNGGNPNRNGNPIRTMEFVEGSTSEGSSKGSSSEGMVIEELN
jgi:hypothetical protein